MKDGSTGNVHKISFDSIFMPVHDNNVVAVHPDLKAVRLTSDAVGFSDTVVHNESPFDQFIYKSRYGFLLSFVCLARCALDIPGLE